MNYRIRVDRLYKQAKEKTQPFQNPMFDCLQKIITLVQGDYAYDSPEMNAAETEFFELYNSRGVV